MSFDPLRESVAPLLAFAASHPVIERLVVASLELALLAVLCHLALALLRPRSARLRAFAWLLVLAKPVATLLLGSPLSLFTVDVTASTGATIPPDAARGAESPEAAGLAPRAFALRRAETNGSTPTPGDAIAPLRATADPRLSTGAVDVSLTGSAPADVAARAPRWPWSAPSTVLVAWLAGVTLMVGRSLLARLRVHQLLIRATPADVQLAALANDLARQFGASRAPPILRSTELDSPALVGLFRPTIMIPTWMVDHRDLHWSLRHELMHLALRDPFGSHLRELAETLLFFHPAAWWSGRKWEEASELACDRAIVANEAESLEYADRLCAIAQIVRRRAAPTLGPAFFVARSRVGRRLEMLLNEPIASSAARFGRGGAAALTLVAFATLAFGARLQSASPGTVAAKPPADDGDVVHIHGRVLDPDGKPVSDAQVEITYGGWTARPSRPVLTTVRSDRDGRFVATYRKEQCEKQCESEIFRHRAWREVTAVAFVDGFGPGWDDTWRKSLDTELQLRLVRDLPVRGRIVDLEGRPVANAAARVTEITASVKEDLGPFLASLRARNPEWKSWLPESAWRGLAPVAAHEWTATTDAKGAFEIHGLGAHRIARLEVRGESIAFLHTMIVTEPLERSLEGDVTAGPDAQQIHGATLELLAQPTQPIEGVVRTADGGAPMADVEVASAQFAGSTWGDEGSLTTTTDEAGRFRLVGMPKGKGNRISLRPNDDQPYFQAIAEVPDRPGLETIEMEIALERGIWITGHVTEAKSGKPGRGVVHYLPFRSNPFMQKRPQLAPGGLDMAGVHNRDHVAADGTFRIVGLPGPAAIGVTNNGRYRQGLGFEAFASEPRGKYGITYDNPVGLSPIWPTSMARIDPPADATSATCDLVLDPGESITLHCVDEQGQPLTDVEICGNAPYERWDPVTGAAISIECLGPAEQRPVAIRHMDRKVGRFAILSLAGGHEQTLTLLPLVTVTGRILDTSGNPVRRAVVMGGPTPGHDIEAAAVKFLADEAGRFRFEALVCGTDWQISAEARIPGSDFPIPLALGEVKEPKPGDVVEFGDVILKPAN